MLNRGSAGRGRRRRGSLDARLFELERFYEVAIAAAHGPTAAERSAENLAKVREIIASRGIVQQDSESLFDALARALQVSSRELRAYFVQRAAGRQPSPHE